MWVLDPSEYAALIGYNCPPNSGLGRQLLEIWECPTNRPSTRQETVRHPEQLGFLSDKPG